MLRDIKGEGGTQSRGVCAAVSVTFHKPVPSYVINKVFSFVRSSIAETQAWLLLSGRGLRRTLGFTRNAILWAFVDGTKHS